MVTVTPHEHCVRIVAGMQYQSYNAEWERAREIAELVVTAIEDVLGVTPKPVKDA
jgi:hypothetical protein